MSNGGGVSENLEVVQSAGETSIRDDVRAAVEKLKENPLHKDDAEKISNAERARDTAGRFSPKNDAADAKEDGKAREVLTLPKEKADAATAQQPQQQSIKAPDGWSPALKAKFAELPAEVQGEIDRREKEMHRRLTAQDGERTLGKQITEAVAPYRAILAAEQADPVAAFRQFLNYAYVLRTGSPQQKAMALHSVAKQYNVPIASPSQAPVDPRLETLQQRLDRIERERHEESNQRQQQEQQSLAGEIEAFAKQPGHEHFADVSGQMGRLLESGIANSLQDAYEKSVRMMGLNASSSTATAETEEQKRAAKEKVDAAKRASGSVTGAPGGAKPNGSAPNPNLSLRDEIRANLRAAQGRV